MAEVEKSKDADVLGETPASVVASKATEESGEDALDGFVKDAHSWFEEEVLAAKLEKEREAEEAKRRAEEAARKAEEEKRKAEAELKAKLEEERRARERAEAEAEAARKAAEEKKKKGAAVPPATAAPAAAEAPAASKNGLYFLVGSAILGVAIIVLALQLGKSKDSSPKSTSPTPAARQGEPVRPVPASMPAAMTEEIRATPLRRPQTQPATTQPATTQPATTQPATTQPAMTQPAMTQPAMTQPAMTPPARRTVRVAPSRPPVRIRRRPPRRRRYVPRRRPPRRRAGGWQNPFG